MLNVTTSPRAEDLVEHLARVIDETRADVFEAVDVLIPNLAIPAFVELHMARCRPIVANVNFHLLEAYFSGIVSKIEGFEDVTLLDGESLRILLIERLHDDAFLARPESSAIVAYLEAAGVDRPGRDRRIFQLAGRIAGYFSEYAYSRGDMLDAWSAGELFMPEAQRTTEVWQRLLWQDIFGTSNIIERDGQRLMFLSRLFEELDDEDLRAHFGSNLHVFGFPYFGSSFESIFRRLATVCDVHFYMLNPCRADWANMPTGKRDEAHLFDAAADLDATHPTLRLWGRAGRDTVHLLGRMADTSTTLPAPRTTGPPTLLQTLQDDLSGATPEYEAREAARPDSSVRFLECTGIQREVETVANAIWRRMLESDEGGKPLNFSDFAIVIADSSSEDYIAQIESVFEAFHGLPFSIVGRKAAAESRILSAVLALLELPFGEFRRGQLLRLLLHPNVLAKCPGADAAAWLTWCERTNILHGHSSDAHKDTYIERDLYNWDQGLRRLALGSFLSGKRSGVDTLYAHDAQLYIPEEIPFSEQGAAASLDVLARSLIEDSRWLVEQEMPLAEWATCVASLIDIYIGADRSDPITYPKELGELALCRLVLESVAGRDVTGQPISLRLATLIIGAALQGLQSKTGKRLVSGVSVGTAHAMQGIPFRHVYVLGMGEGRFPAPPVDAPLDLRHARWCRGDVLPNDRDRYAFLQIFMSARDSLTLSWIAREASTGEELEPSSIISELWHWLDLSGIGPEARTAHLIEVHPLRRFQRAHSCALPLGRNHHPGADSEARLDALHEDLRRYCAEEKIPFPSPETLRELVATRWEVLRKELKLAAPESRPRLTTAQDKDAEQIPTLRISFSKIRNYLKSPLQGMASQHLGFINEDGDSLAVEHEPFAVPNSKHTVELRNVFYRALLQPLASVDLEDSYNSQVLPKAELEGKLPTGIFLNFVKASQIGILNSWGTVFTAGVKKGDFSPNEPVQFYAFGESSENAECLKPIVVQVRRPPHTESERAEAGQTVNVELYGTTQPMSASGKSLLSLTTSKEPTIKYFVDSYVTHLALSASGLSSTDQRVAIVIGGTGKVITAKFSPLTQGAAHKILIAILEDLLFPASSFRLPVEVVASFCAKNGGKPFEELMRASDKRSRGKTSDKYGSIRDWYSYDAPADPTALIHRYFAAYPKLTEKLQ